MGKKKIQDIQFYREASDMAVDETGTRRRGQNRFRRYGDEDELEQEQKRGGNVLHWIKNSSTLQTLSLRPLRVWSLSKVHLGILGSKVYLTGRLSTVCQRQIVWSN